MNADSFLSLVAQEAPNPSPNKSETIIQVVNIIILILVVRTGFEPVSFLADVWHLLSEPLPITHHLTDVNISIIFYIIIFSTEY